MTAPDYAARINALRESILGTPIDCVIITEPHNIQYLCGATGGHSGARIALIVDYRETVLAVDKRYIEETEEEAKADRFISWVKPSFQDVAAIIKESQASRVGFESSHISVRQFERLEEDLSGLMLTGVSGIVEPLREVKDEFEIDSIACAAGIADKAFEYILGYIKPGMSEFEVATELDYFMKRNGAEKVSFDTIVAAGAHSAIPHAVPGARPLANGDFVKLDFGAVVNGYHSDMTRTIVLGEASKRHKEVYALVLEAQIRALNAAVAGAACNTVDAAARVIIESAGLGEVFVHGLGHGVGLEIHEAPSASVGNTTQLRAGNVITIEPGIYLSGFGGVRIEDLVVIGPDRPHILTNSPKELIEL